MTIVLPAYNEEALIGRTLDQVSAYLGSIEDRCSWEMLEINDGSRDQTRRILDEYAGEHNGVWVLHRHTNFNLGQALRYAFSNA